MTDNAFGFDDDLDLGIEPQPESEPETTTEYPPEIPPPVYRTVKLVNGDERDGKYCVVDVSTRKGYLVPVELLNYSMGEQVIEESALLDCEQPYGWDNEIQEILVDVQEVRLALWWSGLVTKDENVDVRNLLSRLLRRGTLPVV